MTASPALARIPVRALLIIALLSVPQVARGIPGEHGLMVVPTPELIPRSKPPGRVKPCRHKPGAGGIQAELSAMMGAIGTTTILFDSAMGGVKASGALAVTWARHPRIGIRLGGYASRQLGELSSAGLIGASSDSSEVDFWQVGFNIGVQVNFCGGLWMAGTLGFGGFSRYEDDEENKERKSDDEFLWIPEVAFHVGYDLNMGKHFALRVGLEFGTNRAFLHAGVNAGVVVRL